MIFFGESKSLERFSAILKRYVSERRKTTLELIDTQTQITGFRESFTGNRNAGRESDRRKFENCPATRSSWENGHKSRDLKTRSCAIGMTVESSFADLKLEYSPDTRSSGRTWIITEFLESFPSNRDGERIRSSLVRIRNEKGYFLR